MRDHGVPLALWVTVVSVWLAMIPVVKAQISCVDAPTPAAKIVCEQLHKWDTNARDAPPVTTKVALPPAIPGLPMPNMAAELAPIVSTPYQCMDLGCLCSYMNGNGQQNSNTCTLADGRPLTRAIRKEYRQLSDDERERFHAAVRQIKASGEYDRLAVIHSQFASAGGAHSGPAFLLWHREYIKRYEIALRQVDPTLGLPYWDSTLDGRLALPKDSVLFSEELLGDSDTSGNVRSGPFAQWRTLNGRGNILRHVGAQGTLFQENELSYVMQQTQIENVLAFTAPRQGCMQRTNWNVLEYTHGNVHIFIGGDMLDQSTSANDPIFYLHHSFVDLIWEEWRQARQARYDRENAYPMDQQLCSSANHFGSAPMRPFEPWRNVDGLSNKYTDNMYEYAPRPSCSADRLECGSKYLFCDVSTSAPRCVSKVRLGGSCAGVTSSNLGICYKGVCQAGRCVAGSQKSVAVTTTRRLPPITVASSLGTVKETCFNEHECCSIWSAKGECQRNAAYMRTWCKASCRNCRPRYSLTDECSDRHSDCGKWSRSGECRKNSSWMSENCRQSCNRCRTTRQQICAGASTGGGGVVTAPPKTTLVSHVKPQTAQCDSPGCYNENVCCQLWGLQGQCSRSAGWMSCNCRVSCGACIPQDYYYGSCEDYHRNCDRWAAAGECGRNGWMLENCRASCESCFGGAELRQMCRISGGGGGRGRWRAPMFATPFGDFGGFGELASRRARRMPRDALLMPPSRGMPSI